MGTPWPRTQEHKLPGVVVAWTKGGSQHNNSSETVRDPGAMNLKKLSISVMGLDKMKSVKSEQIRNKLVDKKMATAVQCYYLKPTHNVPNNSLPVLHYRNLLPRPLTEQSITAFLTANQWEKRVSHHIIPIYYLLCINDQFSREHGVI